VVRWLWVPTPHDPYYATAAAPANYHHDHITITITINNNTTTQCGVYTHLDGLGAECCGVAATIGLCKAVGSEEVHGDHARHVLGALCIVACVLRSRESESQVTT
jgi:hypothetical protein